MNRAANTESGSPSLQRCVISVCDACGDFIEYWGFKAIHGRIWAYLAISTRPLSQRELVEALGMSKGSISVAVKELIDYGLVKPSTDHHHAPYEAVMDVWPVIVGVLREREWMLLETSRLALEGALNELQRIASPTQHAANGQHRQQGEEGSEYQFDADRLRLLLQMTEWAQGVLKLIINARIPRSPERWGSWMGRAVKLGQSLRGLLGGGEDERSR